MYPILGGPAASSPVSVKQKPIDNADVDVVVCILSQHSHEIFEKIWPALGWEGKQIELAENGKVIPVKGEHRWKYVIVSRFPVYSSGDYKKEVKQAVSCVLESFGKLNGNSIAFSPFCASSMEEITAQIIVEECFRFCVEQQKKWVNPFIFLHVLNSPSSFLYTTVLDKEFSKMKEGYSNNIDSSSPAYSSPTSTPISSLTLSSNTHLSSSPSSLHSLPAYKPNDPVRGYKAAGVLPVRELSGSIEILLAHETRQEGTVLNFLGGCKEFGEDPLITATREFFEEMGNTATVAEIESAFGRKLPFFSSSHRYHSFSHAQTMFSRLNLDNIDINPPFEKLWIPTSKYVLYVVRSAKQWNNAPKKYSRIGYGAEARDLVWVPVTALLDEDVWEYQSKPFSSMVKEIKRIPSERICLQNAIEALEKQRPKEASFSKTASQLSQTAKEFQHNLKELEDKIVVKYKKNLEVTLMDKTKPGTSEKMEMAQRWGRFHISSSMRQTENTLKQILVQLEVHQRDEAALVRLSEIVKNEKRQTENWTPLYSKKSLILKTVAEHDVVVLTGATGTGKSTQVPQYLYELLTLHTRNTSKQASSSSSSSSSPSSDASKPSVSSFLFGSKALPHPGRICVLEPRRAIVRALARQVAREMGEEVGQRVGYSLGGRDVCVGPETVIEFMTHGLFLQRCLANRGDGSVLPPDVAAVVVDEAHLRSVEIDLSLAFLRVALLANTDSPSSSTAARGEHCAASCENMPGRGLKVLVMSATIDEAIEPFMALLAPGPTVKATHLALKGIHYPILSSEILFPFENPPSTLSQYQIAGLSVLNAMHLVNKVKRARIKENILVLLPDEFVNRTEAMLDFVFSRGLLSLPPSPQDLHFAWENSIDSTSGSCVEYEGFTLYCLSPATSPSTYLSLQEDKRQLVIVASKVTLEGIKLPNICYLINSCIADSMEPSHNISTAASTRVGGLGGKKVGVIMEIQCPLGPIQEQRRMCYAHENDRNFRSFSHQCKLLHALLVVLKTKEELWLMDPLSSERLNNALSVLHLLGAIKRPNSGQHPDVLGAIERPNSGQHPDGQSSDSEEEEDGEEKENEPDHGNSKLCNLSQMVKRRGWEITPVGEVLLQLGVNVRLGRFILGCQQAQCLESGLQLAAILSLPVDSITVLVTSFNNDPSFSKSLYTESPSVHLSVLQQFQLYLEGAIHSRFSSTVLRIFHEAHEIYCCLLQSINSTFSMHLLGTKQKCPSDDNLSLMTVLFSNLHSCSGSFSLGRGLLPLRQQGFFAHALSFDYLKATSVCHHSSEEVVYFFDPFVGLFSVIPPDVLSSASADHFQNNSEINAQLQIGTSDENGFAEAEDSFTEKDYPLSEELGQWLLQKGKNRLKVLGCLSGLTHVEVTSPTGVCTLHTKATASAHWCLEKLLKLYQKQIQGFWVPFFVSSQFQWGRFVGKGGANINDVKDKLQKVLLSIHLEQEPFFALLFDQKKFLIRLFLPNCYRAVAGTLIGLVGCKAQECEFSLEGCGIQPDLPFAQTPMQQRLLALAQRQPPATPSAQSAVGVWREHLLLIVAHTVLWKTGCSIYGGFVRDWLVRGELPNDIDVEVVGNLPIVLNKFISTCQGHSFQVKQNPNRSGVAHKVSVVFKDSRVNVDFVEKSKCPKGVDCSAGNLILKHVNPPQLGLKEKNRHSVANCIKHIEQKQFVMYYSPNDPRYASRFKKYHDGGWTQISN